MKRFLNRLFWCLIFFVLIYPLVVFFLGTYFPKYFKGIKQTKGDYGHFWSRLREVEQVPKIDVLILGSSTAYRGIDTRFFDTRGIKAFNLGSSSQTPLQSSFLIEKFVDQVKPSIVIWDVNPYTFHSSGYESFIDLCSNGGVNKTMLKQLLFIRELEGINTVLFVSMSQLLTNYHEFEEPILKRQDKYVSGGFVEKDMKVFDGDYEVEPITLNMRKYQLNSFESSIEFLNKKGIKVVLVFAPIYTKTYEGYLNMDAINKYFDAVVSKHKLVGYYNFNEIKIDGLSESHHFYDDYHLNQSGVELYNDALLNILAKNICNYEGTGEWK